MSKLDILKEELINKICEYIEVLKHFPYLNKSEEENKKSLNFYDEKELKEIDKKH